MKRRFYVKALEVIATECPKEQLNHCGLQHLQSLKRNSPVRNVFFS